MEIALEPRSERFDPLDDRWLDQVTRLVAHLHDEVGRTHRASEHRPGTKGVDPGAIVVQVSAAGLFTALAAVIKAFINQDHGRSLRVKWHQGGQLEQIEIRGHNVDDAERLADILKRYSETSA